MSLFQRKHRGIVLTAAGRELAAGAKEMLEQERVLAEKVRAATEDGAESFQLTIGVEEPVMDNTDVCQALIRTLGLMQRRYPGLYVDLRYASMADDDDGRSDFRDISKADLYLCTRRTQSFGAQYRAEILSADRFVLAVSAAILENRYGGRATAQEMLSELPLLLMEHGSHGVVEISGLLDSLHIYPQIRFVSGSEPMELSIALGKGVSILPEKKAKKLEYAGVSILPLPADKSDITLYALSGAGNMNPLVEPFLKQFREYL